MKNAQPHTNAEPGAPNSAEFTEELARLTVQLARRGHSLHRGREGFYVERWGQVRTLPTLADAQRFLRQIGGAA